MAEEFERLLASLSPAGRKAVEDEGFANLEELTSIDGPLLLGIGLKLADLAKINRCKRSREEAGEERDEDQPRTSKNVARLVEANVMEDALDLASLLPANWSHGSLKQTVLTWRQLFSGNPHVWEDLSFLVLLVEQVLSNASPDLQILIWTRLVIVGLKLKFPHAALTANQWLKDALVKEKNLITTSGTQMKIMIELFSKTSPSNANHNSNYNNHQHNGSSNSNNQTSGNSNSNNSTTNNSNNNNSSATRSYNRGGGFRGRRGGS